MRTRISIPDRLFLEAEVLAKTMGLRRSGLYARALEEFLRAHRDEEVTAALNRVYATESSQLDPVLAELQLATLRRNQW
jgi:metal-responsive CopG/Arc/MetJ family transcriptional regulator